MNRITRSVVALAVPALTLAGSVAGAGGLVGASGSRPQPQVDAAPTTTTSATSTPTPTTAQPGLPPLPGSTVPAQPPTTTLPVAPTAPVTTVPGDPAVPAPGYVLLEDVTGLLNVEVPATWTDVNLNVNAADDGTTRPMIAASPDLDSFAETFDTPGMFYVAFPSGADHTELLNFYDWPAQLCQDAGVQPYSDGVFIGSTQSWTGCDGGPAQAHFVVADPPNNEFTAWVFVQTASDADLADHQHILDTFNFDPAAPLPPTSTASDADLADHQHILDTFNFDPAAPLPPTSTAPTTTPVTTTPVGPTTVPAPPSTSVPPVTAPPVTAPPVTTGVPPTTGDVPGTTVAGEFTTVTDDSGRLSVQVPASWADVDGSPETTSGGEVPSLVAAPDVARFRNTYNVPGLMLWEVPYVSDPAAEIGDLAPSDDCTAGAVQQIPNPRFTGVYQQWTDCAGTTTDLYVLVANPVDGTQTTALMLVQVTSDADLPALENALATFDISTSI